ncbi:hypothetical protein CGZ93_08985 [Enemella dayhoffiae]|uniref:Uncharacterized protein n=1 Tax=Enemella dayhoffiae TaxID=2016507 RepID=A0A255H2Z2_9ACTN|nr:hypothetical protein [Enemella dayhoffiae]OYO22045.1 hypothetical protein CGZ93_08985 [Enemella dayhoffiae]
MIDDWKWFWVNEEGRDRILRDEISGLHDEAAASAMRANRLASQVSQLQGSLDQRLTALSRAFDAYVEPGDIRTELGRLPDWSWTWAVVGRAFQDLQAGVPVEPLNLTAHRHPMAYACNAVIAVVSGTPAPELEAKANRGMRRAQLFIAAAAMAVGRADAVRDRLPELLINHRELDEPQAAVFCAVVAGAAGSDAPTELRPVIAPALDRADWGIGWPSANTIRPEVPFRLPRWRRPS